LREAVGEQRGQAEWDREESSEVHQLANQRVPQSAAMLEGEVSWEGDREVMTGHHHFFTLESSFSGAPWVEVFRSIPFATPKVVSQSYRSNKLNPTTWRNDHVGAVLNDIKGSICEDLKHGASPPFGTSLHGKRLSMLDREACTRSIDALLIVRYLEGSTTKHTSTT